MDKILQLTIKKKWFDLIKSGIKTEEYREIKPYFINRLNKKYKYIIFRNGYRKESPQIKIEFKGVEIKMIVNPMTGIFQSVFAIKLGRIC